MEHDRRPEGGHVGIGVGVRSEIHQGRGHRVDAKFRRQRSVVGRGMGNGRTGTPWVDNNGTYGDATNPSLARWEDLDGGGTYGWRHLCIRYINWLLAPVDCLGLFTLPYTTDDLAGTTLDLSTLLNSAQPAATQNKRVVEATFYIELSDTGTGYTTKQPFVGFRPQGASGNYQKFWCPVSGLRVGYTFTIRFGTGANVEKLDFIRQVANASGSLTIHVFDLLSWHELV